MKLTYADELEAFRGYLEMLGWLVRHTPHMLWAVLKFTVLLAIVSPFFYALAWGLGNWEHVLVLAVALPLAAFYLFHACIYIYVALEFLATSAYEVYKYVDAKLTNWN